MGIVDAFPFPGITRQSSEPARKTAQAPHFHVRALDSSEDRMRRINFAYLFAVLAAVLMGALARAGEVQSPEKFLMETYGWNINGLDGERGAFGDYRAFACFDDRIGQPRTEEQSLQRRWGTQCQTVRTSGENLGAMIFLSWVNTRHPKLQTLSNIFEFGASQMAGSQKD